MRVIPDPTVAVAPPTTSTLDALVEQATRLGFELATRETDTGQVVWEWRQHEGPCPQFVTERVARRWMAEWIEHYEPPARKALCHRMMWSWRNSATSTKR